MLLPACEFQLSKSQLILRKTDHTQVNAHRLSDQSHLLSYAHWHEKQVSRIKSYIQFLKEEKKMTTESMDTFSI